MEDITANLEKVRDAISRIRPAEDVRIVAAVKGQSRDRIIDAIKAGISEIGENYVQEAEGKIEGLGAKKHFIGHLQSNKARKAVELFDVIQTVDSSSLARKISAAAASLGKDIEVMIEVNIGGESAKYGVNPLDVVDLAAKIKALQRIRLTGLMAMAPFVEKEAARPYFRQMRLLQQKLCLENLSCGMSNDYTVAVEEGANIIRLGTALFGYRS